MWWLFEGVLQEKQYLHGLPPVKSKITTVNKINID